MTISRALAYTILAYANQGVGEKESIEKVFSYMDTHGLAGFKPAVAKYLERIAVANREQTVVKIYSSLPLSAENKQSILSHYSPDAVIEEKIDASLIGGYRVEHAYEYVDATVANTISRLTQHLLHP